MDDFIEDEERHRLVDGFIATLVVITILWRVGKWLHKKLSKKCATYDETKEVNRQNRTQKAIKFVNEQERTRSDVRWELA